MKKLRLLLFEECGRNCEKCCNKFWDLTAIPICTSYADYDEIMLTGGEPMLRPGLVRQTITEIREENTQTKIYMYTALCINVYWIQYLLELLDGINLTIHTNNLTDIEDFVTLNNFLHPSMKERKSLHLNLFEGVKLPKDINLEGWKVRDEIKWRTDCPLPKDEVLMRLK